MAVVKQLTVTLENRPGALARLCSELAKMAVNIGAISVCPAGATGSVRLLVSQLEVARRVCDSLGVPYVVEDALAVVMGHRPGALGRLTRKLADKGININYLYGSIMKDSKRALVVLGVSDLARASEVAH
jgi:hypothetical protein